MRRTQRSVQHLHGALQSRGPRERRCLTRSRFCEAALRKSYALHRARDTNDATRQGLKGIFVANQEHVDRLRKDVAEWNNWRRDSTEVPDLTGIDLHDVDLNRADLILADLRGANLKYASLINANLSEANLNGANLSEAELAFANLTSAELSEANLSNTVLWETVLANIDLSVATGLETCRHFGPSIVDFRTLAKSHPLPLEFLRGVGLPDAVIDYLPSLLSQPIQYYSCFISYSSKDDDFAKRIHADLQSKGVRCWFAPHDLPIGGKILDEIDAAIRLRDKVVLILSEHSIGSGWVEDEVKTAFEEERRRKQTMLFPIRLDDAVMETGEAWAAKLRADRNIGDFRQWKDHDSYQEVFERVLRDLATGDARKKTG
jgi:uncharacterized protein YjbI with pentapeptide repeats